MVEFYWIIGSSRKDISNEFRSGKITRQFQISFFKMFNAIYIETVGENRNLKTFPESWFYVFARPW